jgi:hypothetical protein
MDGKQLGSDDDTQTSDQLKRTIQDVIWGLVRDVDGQDVGTNEVVAALSDRLSRAGVPEQPHPWVEATALEIAGGRIVVMDVRDEIGGHSRADAQAEPGQPRG